MRQDTASQKPPESLRVFGSRRIRLLLPHRRRVIALFMFVALLAQACGGDNAGSGAVATTAGTGTTAGASASAISLEEVVSHCGVDEIRSGLEDQTEEELVATYNSLLIQISHRHESREAMPAHVVVLGEEGARLFHDGDALGGAAHMDAAVNCVLVLGS